MNAPTTSSNLPPCTSLRVLSTAVRVRWVREQPRKQEPGRGAATWAAFRAAVEGWLPQEAERVYAVGDNLGTRRAATVSLCEMNGRHFLGMIDGVSGSWE